MDSTLGTPAADAKRGSAPSTSSRPIAPTTTPSSAQLDAAPSASSPPFRLLESPATQRDLLPKKTPLGAPLPPVVHAVLDPRTAARTKEGRVIIVGDVHGCAAELRELLSKLNYKSSRSASDGDGEGEGAADSGGDLLVFVGDLVNKGPDPIETLEIAMESGGICVRGNHDEAAVALRHRMEKEGRSVLGGEVAAEQAAAAAAAAAKEEKKKGKDKKDKKNKKDTAPLLPVSELLTHMPWVADPRAERGLRWLSQAPFSLRLESRGVTVVHAGLVPSVAGADSGSSSAATSVESQSLEDLLEVRHVARDSFSAAAAVGGELGRGAADAPPSSAAAASPPRPTPPPPSSSRWRAIDKKLARRAERQGSHASGLSVSLWAREYRAADGGNGGGGGGGEGAGDGSGAREKQLPLAPSPRSAGHVVFGHHASLGLQEEPSATGIDTGCVLGGELTALVLGPLRRDGDEKREKNGKKEGGSSFPSSPSPSSSSAAAGWRNLPGGGTLVSVKARRAYVGKEAADAGAEEC